MTWTWPNGRRGAWNMTGPRVDRYTPMKRDSLLLTAPRHLEWVPEELPELEPHEVLVQTRAGAISLGTELPLYCGTSRHTKSRPYPYMTGYESLGTVIICGSAVQRLHPGDRVVAFYGHRTHAI